MKNRRRHWFVAILLLGLIFPGKSFTEIKNVSTSFPLEAGTEADTNHAAQFCIKPIGDFNGDGTVDYAISAKKHVYPRIAYLYLGGEITLGEIDLADLTINPDVVVIRGPAAAPFLCTPEFEKPTVVPMPPYRTLQVLPPADSSSPVGRPTYYKLVDLDTGEPYPSGYPMANGINAHGHVVGELNGRAVRYNRDSMHSLGTLGGDRSEAFDINNDGDVVGVSLTGETDEMGLVSRPFIHDGFQMEAIDTPRGGAANKINDKDQIVGGMWIEGDWYRPYRAFLHQAGQTLELGTLGGDESEAHSINAAGQIVGESLTLVAGTDQISTRAFIYANGVMKDLGALGHVCYGSDDEGYITCYEESVATDINDKGQIVGFSTTDAGPTHAFLIDRGTMKDLGTLGGSSSWAYAINNSGQIVGNSLSSGDTAYLPFFYDRSTMYNLNELIVDRPANSFQPFWARDINDFGQIVGSHLILDPIYEEVRTGAEFAFQEILGKAFRFEYWISTPEHADEPCRKAWAGLQVKIEMIENNKRRSHYQKYINRWFSADHLVSSKRWDKKWRQAAIFLPEELQGQDATIRIRVRQVGNECGAVVYMRHFDMNP